MIILIALLLVVLATCIVAYFAAQTWHWAYVLVVVFLVISTTGFFLLTAETLRIHRVLGKAYKDNEAKLNDAEARLAALKKGTTDSGMVAKLRSMDVKMPEDAASVPSIEQLDHELRVEMQARGPVWRHVSNAGVDPQSLAVSISAESPTPAGIVQNSVVYLFEEGEPATAESPRGAQYLGEFRVIEAAGQTAKLAPALEFDDEQRQRLATSRGPWIMYENMPPDQYETFAGMNEEQLRKKLPAPAVEEFIRHGKPSRADDDDFHKAAFDADGNRVPLKDAKATETRYNRPLRDFAQDFRQLSERRSVLLVQKAGLEQDGQRLKDALASAQRLTENRQAEIAKLKSDLAGINRDRQAVDRLLALVQQQAATIQTMLNQTMQENGRLVRELAARQAAATKALNEPSPSASQAAPQPLALEVTK